jgi:hypothetical protein
LFSLQQNWRSRGQNRFCLEAGHCGTVAQTLYMHLSKYKNDKIKGERKNQHGKIGSISKFQSQTC